VVVIVGVIAFLWQWRARVLAKRAVDKKTFEAALGSDRLEILGGYLRNQLGTLRLDVFADSENVRDRTRKYLARLRAYLNQPAPPAAGPEEPAQFELDQNSATELPVSTTPSVIVEAQSLLSEGKGWSAFALLRRELERILRSKGLLGERRALPPPSSIEPKNLQAAYGIFLRTANRSIHGEDVSSEEEERAAKAASFIFERLDQISIKSAERHRHGPSQ